MSPARSGEAAAASAAIAHVGLCRTRRRACPAARRRRRGCCSWRSMIARVPRHRIRDAGRPRAAARGRNGRSVSTPRTSVALSRIAGGLAHVRRHVADGEADRGGCSARFGSEPWTDQHVVQRHLARLQDHVDGLRSRRPRPRSPGRARAGWSRRRCRRAAPGVLCVPGTTRMQPFSAVTA